MTTGSGTLAERTAAAVARALASEVLRPLPSTAHEVVEDGVPFVLRAIRAFEQKPRGTREADPFLPPWTDALFVEDRGPDHALLLNKFPVLADHLLLVTRAWADQEAPPDEADLTTLQGVLDELDGLWFYNGGRAAGASQPHRHLQLVPRTSLGAIPLEARWLAGLDSGRVEGFRFRHHVLPGLDPAAVRAVLGQDPGPHTLLGTRDLTLVVPRSVAVVDGQPVNSLAFAGYLAAKTDAGVDAVRTRGPFGVLAAAAVP